MEMTGRLKSLQNEHGHKHSVALMLYDLIFLVLTIILLLVFNPSKGVDLSIKGIILQLAVAAVSIYACRILGGIYNHVWRYGSTTLYIRLIISDAAAGVIYYIAQRLLPIEKIAFLRVLSIISLDLIMVIFIRFVYQYLYEYSSRTSKIGNFIRRVTRFITGLKIEPAMTNAAAADAERRINIAIVGAGRIGVMLAESLINNPNASYRPCCFVDINVDKIGRLINGIKVFSEKEATKDLIDNFMIQEVVLAIPEMTPERRKEQYEYYRGLGCKVKVYDYPTTRTMTMDDGKRHLREFDIEDLLFRKQMDINDEKTRAYYHGKTVLISGGGGSIGGELCRQIAKMEPKRLIILDIYENGAYDVQQELAIAYGAKLDLVVEIVSVCDRQALERVFERHRPHIVLHAAAHKHVPLMERNCCEAVRNNVFGTLTIVETAEKYNVSKFTMISTDKAVNPTNVMGATKRMCEMIVQSRNSATNFSATRFGNVLGSNGSVIPLFKRQIANGGPVTITDKRIIRYFMTIPEASQLVLQSGAMAKNGELYVLDMGRPVKILELAENMIRLSGFEPYKDINIEEVGLRPGEKLYEELLIKTEDLDKTDNELIFVERDKPLGTEEIEEKLEVLRDALKAEDDDVIRDALKKVVPTYHSPEEVNADAVKSEEMKICAAANT